MGAWGIHFNENDGALDFLGDIEDTRDWALVDAKINEASTDDGYIVGDEILAACELVVAALGNPSPRLDEGHREWSMGFSRQAQALREASVAAAQYVMTQSELAELWEETDEFEDWKKSVAETISRL